MLRLYVINTDIFSNQYVSKIREIIKEINLKSGDPCDPFAILVEQAGSNTRSTRDSLYGYDSTDKVLDFLIEQVLKILK